MVSSWRDSFLSEVSMQRQLVTSNVGSVGLGMQRRLLRALSAIVLETFCDTVDVQPYTTSSLRTGCEDGNDSCELKTG